MKLLAALSAILLLAYPFAVYYGVEKYGLPSVALVLSVLFITRILAGKMSRLNEFKYLAFITAGMGLLLLLLSYLLGQNGWLKFYPVAVNSCMFLLFFQSLFKKQSLVERFARIQTPDLPESGVQYTRKVTKVWCLFFIINGVLALFTCFLSMEVWAIYNGLISYMAIGLVFLIEFFIRIQVKKKNGI